LNKKIEFLEKTLIMGVINVTHDSFYKESRYFNLQEAVDKALYYNKLGADIVDIGGESTRPGSEGVSIQEECDRVLPVIEKIRKDSNVLISIDTYKPEVATKAVELGADIINDISGLSFGKGLENVAAKTGVYIVLMHIRGKPKNMQTKAVYSDVVKEVSDELDISINKALDAGIKKEKIIIDPGIGFSKLKEHNVTLLKNLPLLRKKGYPILIGLSRKSFLGAFTGLEPQERLIPTVAANAISILLSADIIRVHDVKEAIETVKIADAIKRS